MKEIQKEIQPATEGRIITFYSYKGGTGRSMALANVAWILASNGKRVLVVDWDLEAPGLHRYFHPFLNDKNLNASEGLMEFVGDYVAEALTPAPPGVTLPEKWYVPHADIRNVAQSIRFNQFRKPGTIDLVPAGRQSDSYAETMSAFNWPQFYDKLGGHAFFEAVKDHMRAAYDYVLIDSRTGVSDTSGICTIQMPDTVVICFTLNIQSLEGATAVANAIEQRRRSEGREIRILPVPTRVDRSEKAKVELARLDTWRKFDRFLWQFTPQERADYWNAIEIPYEPWYAFEEVLAPFGDRTRHQSSVLSAMETLTSYVTEGAVTRTESLTETERTNVLAQYSRRRENDVAPLPDVSTRGEQAMARLSGVQQARALDVLVRLAHFAIGTEPVAQRIERRLLGDVPERSMQALQWAQLVNVTKQPDGTEWTELAGADVLNDWSRLKRAIDGDFPFLLWRQKLSEDAAAYERTGNSDFLLSGSRLAEARRYMALRAENFNNVERKLFSRSLRRRRTVRLATAAAIVLPFLAFFGNWLRTRTDSYQTQQIFAAAPKIVNRDASDSQKEYDALEAWIRALVAAGRHQDARDIVVASHNPARGAFASAVLASALTERGVRSEAERAKNTATEMAEQVTSSQADRARTLIRMANVLGSQQQHRETSTRLLLNALELTRIMATEDDSGPKGSGRPNESKAASAALMPDRPPDDAALTTQFALFRDITVELASVRQPVPAKDALREALQIELDPRPRARLVLELADRLEAFPDTADLAYTARKSALQKLVESAPPGLFSGQLQDSAAALTKSGSGRNYELLLDAISDERVGYFDKEAVLDKVFASLARWRSVRPRHPVWSKANAILRKLPTKDTLLAELAVAQAACGDSAGAQSTLREAESASHRGAAPDNAGMLARLSEARCRIDGKSSNESEEYRREAIAIAREKTIGFDQSYVLMLAAVAAARCGNPGEAVTLLEGVSSDVVSGLLSELIVNLAETAAALPDDSPNEAVRSIVRLSPRFDSLLFRDQVKRDSVTSFVSAVKPQSALTVAESIEDDDSKLAAYNQIVDGIGGKVQDADLTKLALGIKDPYPRVKALLVIARRQFSRGNRGDSLDTIAEAENVARSIGDGAQKSDAWRLIASAYADAGDLRNGRRAADLCGDASDKLRGFAAVVMSWAKRQAPQAGLPTHLAVTAGASAPYRAPCVESNPPARIDVAL